ncbi:unnamed protein product [Cochlearia groenlandica]
MVEDLLVVKGKLAAMPLPSMDLDELARRFENSPPPSDEVESETALVLVETQATDSSVPLAAVPLTSAPFDQFGSMTVSLTVEDAQSLIESDPPEEPETHVEGGQASAVGERGIALIEEETAQLGTGASEET